MVFHFSVRKCVATAIRLVLCTSCIHTSSFRQESQKFANSVEYMMRKVLRRQQERHEPDYNDDDEEHPAQSMETFRMKIYCAIHGHECNSAMCANCSTIMK